MSTQEILLKNYKKPEYSIQKIHLDVDIKSQDTTIKSIIEISHVENKVSDLFLNGEELECVEVLVNDTSWEYKLSEEGITLLNLPSKATIKITNKIKPQENFKLEGFYQSGDILCTQCESEGFRRITYYLDRPDVMTTFTTKITADKKSYPILLSNGNLIDSGDLDHGRHFVEWHDPHAKPCYLFAMVAGDLAKVTDSFTTRSKKHVAIEFFVQHGNESKTQHAITSLKKAMKWDEDQFDLEYDLDTYMVVAVDSFNAGAMENKGLNIFNSQYVLADQQTATDQDFLVVEGVIAHEYFHNWTGNRVTCRDWFQLTLKEGLTVYRDQEFSADMNSRPVQRMFDVRILKEHQYAEDSGPTSHPIRPEKYVEINNFYTTTVYNKGAEVIRMIEMYIGKELFRKGISIYFENFDGQAVTTEDFIWAMEQASGKDFTIFKRWYNQSGTPKLEFNVHQDLSKSTVDVQVKQLYREKTNDHKNEAFSIPVDFALISESGETLKSTEKILDINEDETTFTFKDINVKVVPSLLRRFSAPVKIEMDYTDEDLIHLAKFDSDQFNRNEAVQRIYRNKILKSYQDGMPVDFSSILDFIEFILNDRSIDASLKAEMLSLPGESELIEECDIADYPKMYTMRQHLIQAISNTHFDQIQASYIKLFRGNSDYSIDAQSMANRKLQNVLLDFIAIKSMSRVKEQYKISTNMTDALAAFKLICHSEEADRQNYIDSFASKWSHDFLVMNKWLIAQSTADHPDVYHHVHELLSSQHYNPKNPNNIRSVLRGFGRNYHHFHDKSGKAYALLADQILKIDSFNAGIAANISLAFRKYAVLPESNKAMMKTQLQRILDHNGLSKDVQENVGRILNSEG